MGDNCCHEKGKSHLLQMLRKRFAGFLPKLRKIVAGVDWDYVVVMLVFGLLLVASIIIMLMYI